MFVFIYRTIKQYIGQLAIAYSQRKISDKTFGKYLLIDFPGFVGFCKIFKKVGSDQVFAGYFRYVDGSIIDIRDFTLRTDCKQRIKTCFNQASGILRFFCL